MEIGKIGIGRLPFLCVGANGHRGNLLGKVEGEYLNLPDICISNESIPIIGTDDQLSKINILSHYIYTELARWDWERNVCQSLMAVTHMASFYQCRRQCDSTTQDLLSLLTPHSAECMCIHRYLDGCGVKSVLCFKLLEALLPGCQWLAGTTLTRLFGIKLGSPSPNCCPLKVHVTENLPDA